MAGRMDGGCGRFPAHIKSTAPGPIRTVTSPGPRWPGDVKCSLLLFLLGLVVFLVFFVFFQFVFVVFLVVGGFGFR